MDASRSLLLKLLRLLSGSISEEIRMFSILSDASPFTDLRKHSSAREQASSPTRPYPVLKTNYTMMKNYTTVLKTYYSMMKNYTTDLKTNHPMLKNYTTVLKTYSPVLETNYPMMKTIPCSEGQPP